MDENEKDPVVKVSVSIPGTLWAWVCRVSIAPGQRSQVVTAALNVYRESLLSEPPAQALYRVAEDAARYRTQRKQEGLQKIKKAVKQKFHRPG